MATSITRRPSSPPPHPGVRLDEFVVEASTAAPHPNVPQQMAAKLMTPSLTMGLMGLAAGLVLAIVRADATSADEDRAAIRPVKNQGQPRSRRSWTRLARCPVVPRAPPGSPNGNPSSTWLSASAEAERTNVSARP